MTAFIRRFFCTDAAKFRGIAFLTISGKNVSACYMSLYRADSALAMGAVNPLLTIPLSVTISADFIKNITSLLLNIVFCYRIKTVAYYRKTAVKLKPLLLG